ncbi:MAG: cystathionine gamma-synthase family protein [Bacteroidetes bacterium]|nr:cystathionine gamma-synthase family protein [Bacteroidota bacterium]
MDKQITLHGKTKTFKPESLMMSYGYHPEWSEGAVKCPIFQTSTFVFATAEDGKEFFEIAYGKKEPGIHGAGLIYSRINNPDLEILEDRLTLWDEAESCAVFESGMAAICTTLFEFLQPGDVILCTEPVYGGTDHLLSSILPKYGITTLDFDCSFSKEQIIKLVEKANASNRVKLIFIETPANPTNSLFDLEMLVDVANHFSSDTHRVITVVDNTFLGPLFQHPLKFGVDLVIYSATKYIGGHSDVVAGACVGPKHLISRIKSLRSMFGNMAGPWTGWLLLRSLETLKIRMERAATTAHCVAEWLAHHPKVEKVHYLGLLQPGTLQYEIYKKQCLGPGAMISFELHGTETTAFKFLNALKLFKLAVSLGGTESLAEHPATMTHSAVKQHKQRAFGITENLIRLSIGMEDPDDLIWDIGQALASI